MALVPNAPQPESGEMAQPTVLSASAQPKPAKRVPGVQNGAGASGGIVKRAVSTAARTRSAATRVQRQYQQAQIETASPTRLIVLLYDGVVRFCTLALEAMQARRIEEQHQNLIRAQRIVSELMVSLDKEAGGEVANNLFRLYTYLLDQLVRANLNDDTIMLAGAIKMLSELRETWMEVDRLSGQGQANSPPRSTCG